MLVIARLTHLHPELCLSGSAMLVSRNINTRIKPSYLEFVSPPTIDVKCIRSIDDVEVNSKPCRGGFSFAIYDTSVIVYNEDIEYDMAHGIKMQTLDSYIRSVARRSSKGIRSKKDERKNIALMCNNGTFCVRDYASYLSYYKKREINPNELLARLNY